MHCLNSRQTHVHRSFCLTQWQNTNGALNVNESGPKIYSSHSAVTMKPQGIIWTVPKHMTALSIHLAQTTRSWMQKQQPWLQVRKWKVGRTKKKRSPARQTISSAREHAQVEKERRYIKLKNVFLDTLSDGAYRWQCHMLVSYSVLVFIQLYNQHSCWHKHTINKAQLSHPSFADGERTSTACFTVGH